MFGCQSIADRQDPRAAGPRQACRVATVAGNRADRVAAAMEIQHDSVRVRVGGRDPLRRHTTSADWLQRDVGCRYEGGRELLPTGTGFLDARLAGDLGGAKRRNELVKFRRRHGILSLVLSSGPATEFWLPP